MYIYECIATVRRLSDSGKLFSVISSCILEWREKCLVRSNAGFRHCCVLDFISTINATDDAMAKGDGEYQTQ